MIGGLGFAAGSRVVDLGCGEGDFSLELAHRFEFAVQGIDPVDRHIEISNDKLASEDEGVRGRVRFDPGSAERIPCGTGSVDLVLCREMLYHVPVLETASRGMPANTETGWTRSSTQLFSTELLEPREAELFWNTPDTFPAGADQGRMEAAIVASGLRIDQDIELGSETGEWSEEQQGRSPGSCCVVPGCCVSRSDTSTDSVRPRMTSKSATRAGTFPMIGKLSNRIYVGASAGPTLGRRLW